MSEQNRCTACHAKDVIIQRQRQQIELLKREIRRLRQILKNAKAVCSEIVDQANSIMSQHQPRGKWSFAKGAGRTATTIAKWLAG